MTSAAEKRHSGRLRRQRRVRKKIHGTADRPRLAVFRSNKHLSAQLIDDDAIYQLESNDTEMIKKMLNDKLLSSLYTKPNQALDHSNPYNGFHICLLFCEKVA